MKKKIVISYFPTGLKFATPLFFGAGVYGLFNDYAAVGIISILLGIIIITTCYVTLIDLEKKKCKDYVSFLGMPFNLELITFTNLDRIVITKGKYSQAVRSRIQDRQFDWADYTGTLVMDNDKKLTLLTTNNKKELIKGLKEFSEFLKVDVEDRTLNDFYWIDMTKF